SGGSLHLSHRNHKCGGGLAFGCPMGTLLILTGIALGSAAIFFIVRHLGMKVVEFFVPREKIDELAFIKSEKRRTLFVLITFLIPGTPKRTISYFMGMTSMPAATFVLVSTLARLPTIAISTYGGEALGSQKYIMALIIFVAMIVAGIAGMLVYRRIWKSKRSPKA
ncbi:MAG: TVP38/TMEM64 family protein, partial [Clostridia bacterium]